MGMRSRKKTEEETRLLLELADVFPNVRRIFNDNFCEDDVDMFNTNAGNTPIAKQKDYTDEEKVWEPAQILPSS